MFDVSIVDSKLPMDGSLAYTLVRTLGNIFHFFNVLPEVEPCDANGTFRISSHFSLNSLLRIDNAA